MIGDWQVTEAIDKIKAMQYFDIEVSIEKPFKMPKNMPFQLKFVDGLMIMRVKTHMMKTCNDTTKT